MGTQRPKLPLDMTDKVYIDQLLLQYDACWMYAWMMGRSCTGEQVSSAGTEPQDHDEVWIGTAPAGTRSTVPNETGSDSGYFVLDGDPLA